LFGNDGDDLLSGDEGNDYLQGGFGADTLQGGDGDDRLDGTFAVGDALFGPYDEDAGDTLDGGAGDDLIVVGAHDIATGGEGADTFVTGSYIDLEVDAGSVTDFDPSRDVIEVLYDPELDPDPVIAVEDFADGTGADVLFDGQVILRLNGGQGLDPGAITLRQVDFDANAERV
jgi:Ca2+-binding RTX toxin-like protein